MQKKPTQHKNDKKKSRSFSLFKPRDRQPNYILSVLCTTVALLLVVVLVMGMGGFGLVMGVAKAYYDTTPELDVEKIETQNLTSFIYDCNGDLITAYRGSENRIWANFDEIPDQLAKAFVAVEDARFYTHNGIDIKRIIGAFGTTGNSPITWADAATKAGYKDGELVIVGMDATEGNLDYLEAGKVTAIVAQPLYEEAYKTMEYLDKIFRGEEVPMWTDLVAPVVTVDGEGENGLAYHRDIAAQVAEFFK